MELNCASNNIKSQIFKMKFLIKWIFFIINRLPQFSPPLYLGEISDHMNEFACPKLLFKFFRDFPIVILIVIQKRRATPQNSSYKLFFSEPYDRHTMCQRSACMVGCCANQGTLVYTVYQLLRTDNQCGQEFRFNY